MNSQWQHETPEGDRSHPREMARFYNDLLTLFVKDLNKKNIRVMMVAVNHQLDEAPLVRQKVHALARDKLISFLDVTEWFDRPLDDYMSPEGHEWGREAHEIIGTQIASFIRQHDSIDSMSSH